MEKQTVNFKGRTVIILLLLLAFAAASLSQSVYGNTVLADNSEAKGDWKLLLVNKENPISEKYQPDLAEFENGMLFDKRAVKHLEAMLSAARDAGLSPSVCSAYRTIEKQESLFGTKVNALMSDGMSRKAAVSKAGERIAPPGTSEHHLGLAVDIVSSNYQALNDDQQKTAEAKWLRKHCSKYGFILRYTKDKTKVTGIDYEPWHFRYVGKKAAKEMMKTGLSLEEYLEVQNKLKEEFSLNR